MNDVEAGLESVNVIGLKTETWYIEKKFDLIWLSDDSATVVKDKKKKSCVV